MVCVYSIKNERVMVILEEKTENAKNPISQKSMDLGIILVSVNPTSWPSYIRNHCPKSIGAADIFDIFKTK